MTLVRRISFRANTIAFALLTGAVTAAAMGLFVLMDPRAQLFWVARLSDAVAFVRALFEGR